MPEGSADTGTGGLPPHLRALLADDWGAVDPELPGLIELLMTRSAGEDWHKAGTFKEHLLGTLRVLTLWNQPREVCLAGLFHSVYSNEYVNLKLFDAQTGRSELAAALGAETEALVHTLCTMPRTVFTQRIIEMDRIPESGMDLPMPGGGTMRLTARDAAAIAIITAADIAEQWFAWVDGVFSGFPNATRKPTRENWATTLWPGTMRPSGQVLSLLSRVLRPVRDLPAAFHLPTPPVFDGCTTVLPPDIEQAASSLYWQVMGGGETLGSPEATQGLLLAAIGCNPFVGEPHAVLAQIALSQRDFDLAATHAAKALTLLTQWGVAWDKRIAWAGWVAWARILLQSAERRTWPETMGGHMGLGLVG